MAINYDLAQSDSLRFAHPQAQMNAVLLTTKSMPKDQDCTGGSLSKALAATGKNVKPVYVVSELYLTSLDTGAINLLWDARYYCVRLKMDPKPGNGPDWQVTKIHSMAPSDAMNHAYKEFRGSTKGRKLSSQAQGNALLVQTATQVLTADDDPEDNYNNDNYNNN